MKKKPISLKYRGIIPSLYLLANRYKIAGGNFMKHLLNRILITTILFLLLKSVGVDCANPDQLYVILCLII